MTDRELLQQALEVLEEAQSYTSCQAWSPSMTKDCAEIAKEIKDKLENEFNPDWDQIEALRESLREYMAEIQRLRARLAQFEPWVKTYSGGKPNYTEPCERCGEVNPAEIHTCTPKQPFEYWNAVEGWVKIEEVRPVKVQDERETQYKSWAQSAQVIGGQYDPRRELVGLTNEEKKVICQEAANEDWTDLDVINATEAKLREKNA